MEKLVYLAGPLSPGHGYDTQDNVASAAEVLYQLTNAGIAAYCPHLTALAPGAFSVAYDKWMDVCFTILARCDAVLMLPRWETSFGSLQEYQYARKLGIPVLLNLSDLIPDPQPKLDFGEPT